MTDKQIIIDGVDVSGCEFYFGGCCSTNGYADCTDAPNCYYKQLKRKEQECERLEKQNEILLGQLVINDGEDVTVQISQSQFEEYNQLKTENEELKKLAETHVAETIKRRPDDDDCPSEHWLFGGEE